jgi:predicted nucleotidyltransferase
VLAEFRPRALLVHLTARGVNFVVVGGIALTLYGSERNTFDLDVRPAMDPANLEALGRALIALDAQLRGVDEDVPFVPDGRTLRAVEILTLSTSLGPLDVLMNPDGAPSYEQMRRRATRVDVGDAAVLVASIADLIEMKASAGRPKDLEDVERLEAIERLRRRLEN